MGIFASTKKKKFLKKLEAKEDGNIKKNGRS